VIDAELDARDAAEAAGAAAVAASAGAAPLAAAEPAAAASPASSRPWWESDPRVAGRFQALDEQEQ